MSGKLSRQVFNLDYVCPVLGTKLKRYEVIILQTSTDLFGEDSSCGNFIINMHPTMATLASACYVSLDTLKRYLAILRKRKLLETNAKAAKVNNIYYVNLLAMKPFLMTDEQIEDFLSN